MSAAKVARLHDRGVVSVIGPNAGQFLQGLITNDMAAFENGAAAIHAGLLSPQGKILFDVFVVQSPGGFVLEIAGEKLADFVKRLTMYKLRADVTIGDASADFQVLALWGEDASSSGETVKTIAFGDPRLPALGLRILAEARFASDIASATNGVETDPNDYHAHRIELGVPEGGKDFLFGDTVPHEADFDLFHGVSFTKGCYVGQEVVARMQNKSIIRKRVVGIAAAAPLTSGADIMLGDVVIGRVGSVAGQRGLALIRLDRAAEAVDKGTALTADDHPIVVDADAIHRYRASAAARSAVAELPRRE